MTKYSIIVVAYNIEDFVGECLESCVFAGRDDYEVIVVYNASSDKTLEAIHRVTDRHPDLFRLVVNDENVGLGEGRNQGMRLAKGAYFLFLDGDDFLSPAVLPKIADIVQRESPELIVINFVRLYQGARQEPNKGTRFLTEGWRRTPGERAILLRNFGVAWNKVYCRKFIERHALSFPTGFYEDIVWNAECLMRAQAIYVLPDVLYFYRQRPGSILRSTDPRHFDTICRHRRLIAILRAEPGFVAGFGALLRRYSCNQMFATLNFNARIPRGEEGRYLREVGGTLRMYDDLLGRKAFSLRETIARSGSYAAYRTYRYFERKVEECEAMLGRWRKRKLK